MSPNTINSSTLQQIVVIDIGGTNIRAGIAGVQGQLLEKPIVRPTPNSYRNPNIYGEKLISLLLEEIIDIVTYLRTTYSELRLNQLAISFAGPIDSSGRVLNAATIWGTKVGYPVPLKDLVEGSLKLRSIIANDITAAAYGYGNMPCYKRYPLICVITVSSGIGAKVYDVRANKVLIDESGFGGEIGHFVYSFSDSAPPCECGGKGHLGALASGRAAEELARRLAQEKRETFQQSSFFHSLGPESITAEQIAEGAKIGDRFALGVINRLTFPLAHVISCIALAIGVKRFIIIGGFALGAGYPYLNSLRKNLKNIGVFCLNDEEVEEMVTLGELEYPELIGIGLIAQKFIAESGKQL